VTGGADSRKVLRWTATSKTWEKLCDMPCTRWNHVSVCITSKLHVIGGIVDGKASGSVHQLSLNLESQELQRWNPAPSVPIIMTDIQLATLGPKLYLLGSIPGTLRSALFCLDPHDRKGLSDWVLKAGFWDGGSEFGLAAGPESLLVAGGRPEICKSYDPDSDTWTDLTTPSQAHVPASLVWDRNSFVILSGGNKMEECDEDGMSWRTTEPRLPKHLCHHTPLILNM
jgi:hypothetical protein